MKTKMFSKVKVLESLNYFALYKRNIFNGSFSALNKEKIQNNYV